MKLLLPLSSAGIFQNLCLAPNLYHGGIAVISDFSNPQDSE